MSNQIIQIFKEITKIKRCSGNHKPFIEFLTKISSEYNFECFVDNFNNILCRKKNCKAKIALQSHYDMVCIGNTNCIEVLEDKNMIKAKDSTLGADNGIGCAYMIALMMENYDCEYVFTSDEEIGLIGASNFSFSLQSKKMLNLDSEEEGEIIIGCAGSVDIIAKNKIKKISRNDEKLNLYEISVNNLPGGHSGVDIDKNIPNAIKILANYIKDCNGKILDINGGERINAIPANAKAIIATRNIIKSKDVKVLKINTKSEHCVFLDNSILDFICNFKNGILQYNNKILAPQRSVNLAIVKTGIDCVEIKFSMRSMDNPGIKEYEEYIVKELKKYNFSVECNDKYKAWDPIIDDFSKEVLEEYKKIDKNAKILAIHAGLECSLFKNKYDSMQVASIGPTIKNPHSKQERVYKNSIDVVYKVVKNIVNNNI